MPASKDEWWQAVDDNWQSLLEIIFHHMDHTHPAYDTPGQEDTPETGRNIAEELEHLREARDSKLARYLQASWCLASDAYAWSVDGWGQFCDLCSEEHVLYEEEEGANQST